MGSVFHGSLSRSLDSALTALPQGLLSRFHATVPPERRVRQCREDQDSGGGSQFHLVLFCHLCLHTSQRLLLPVPVTENVAFGKNSVYFVTEFWPSAVLAHRSILNEQLTNDSHQPAAETARHARPAGMGTVRLAVRAACLWIRSEKRITGCRRGGHRSGCTHVGRSANATVAVQP